MFYKVFATREAVHSAVVVADSAEEAEEKARRFTAEEWGNGTEQGDFELIDYSAREMDLP